MQIDFHHAVTYLVARIAGFSHENADIVAYSAQYVDDATCSGTIRFKNGAQYHRISSAHAMLDLKNLDAGDNREVWLPFHFLPGNGGMSENSNPGGKFINKLICLPDSAIANDMVRTAIIDRGKPCGLHRLGIAMHVYADTWAHQNFAGVLHRVNDVENAAEKGKTGAFDKLETFLGDVLDETIPPLGHGRATILPDMPFLNWSYTNGQSEQVVRNNSEDFFTAADRMCIAMRRYIAGDPDAPVQGIDPYNNTLIKRNFSEFKDKEGNNRHRLWLDTIRNGTFTIGKTPLTADVVYNEKGRNSWKAQALGTALELEEYEFNQGFLTSNWKMFHDALQSHRFAVLHEILPRYGICAA